MEEPVRIAKNVNFELEQYIHEVFHEVQALVYSEGDGVLKEDKFTEFVLDSLADAGETEGPVICNYTKPNERGNIDFKVNAFAIRENYETLDLFITHFRDINNLYALKKAELDDNVRYITKFANAALKGYLEEIEPSNQAYNLAQLIRKNSGNLDRINIFILTNGNITAEPPSAYKFKGFDNLNVIFHIWDIERFHRLSQSKDNREPIIINFKEIYDEEVLCLKMPVNNEVYECYLAIVPGKILSILYDNYSSRLLESNVRAFLQQTGKVNPGIAKTIRGDKPYMFLPYNNGLSVTASEVETETIDNQMIIKSIKDFQIVNGGQTTASLFHTEKSFNADLSQIYVQMKLTVIKDTDLKNLEVPNISKFANSQNKVSDLDLSSNHPYLQRIEQLSRTTYAIDPVNHNKQSVWFFERVKGQYKEMENKEPGKSKKEAFKAKYPSDHKFVKSEIAKYLNIWNRLPYFVSLGAEKNYTKFLDVIKKDFATKQPNKVYYQDLIANAILFKNAESLYGRKGKEPVGDTNIRSFVVSYGLSLLHEHTGNRLNLERIWNEQALSENLQQEITRFLYFAHKHLTASKESMVSEFAKKKSTWDDLVAVHFDLDKKVLKDYIMSDTEFSKRYSEEVDDAKEAAQYASIEKITGLTYNFWDGLSKWLIVRDDFSTIQKNFAYNIKNKLFKGGQLSDLEIKHGLSIIENLQASGIETEYIASLSLQAEGVSINTSEIYNRLSNLKEDDWRKVMEIGEQTKLLSFNDIAILKTVIKKLKSKEQIDIKRLAITNECLDKVRKFVKY
jgi:hypothetical protein